MFSYFVVLDTNYDSITSLLATRILYFGPFRGVMKIRIAVTLVVFRIVYLYKTEFCLSQHCNFIQLHLTIRTVELVLRVQKHSTPSTGQAAS